MKLNVYGRIMEIAKSSEGWIVFYVGNEGKKRTAHDIVIPQELKEKELINYMEDICHEWATPSNREIFKIE